MTPPHMTRSLADALDTLYGSPPGEFTAKRTALVRELREAGEARAASDLAARKRPTHGAYLLNQLARRHPSEVQALVDLGRTLTRAQRGTLRSGDGSALRDAVKRQRDVLASLATRSSALAKELGVTVSRVELNRAFHAALEDPAIGVALEAGTLSASPQPGGGFAGLQTEATEALARPAPRARDEASERTRKIAAENAARRAASAESEAKSSAARERAEAAAAKAARKKERAEAERTARAQAKRTARAEAAARAIAKRAAAAEREARSLETLALRARKAADVARARADSLRVAAERARAPV
jgi:hypothetical protein